jgi:DHA3 family macrolide efflux protein-like MFS transporter
MPLEAGGKYYQTRAFRAIGGDRSDGYSGTMWNKNIILLWQGQLVSAVGDMVYQVALGFWVLAFTGSTAVMGIVIAAGFIPRALVSPFAGVLVDRANRKAILVAMDFFRGVAVVIVAVAAFGGWLSIPLIIAAAVIIGLCAAFFDPSVTSTIPSIAAREHLVQVNSLFAINQSGAGILGNAIGGIMFAALGAPVLFLVNGISYLVSAFTELFMTIPAVKQETSEFHFFADMKQGLKFIFAHQGMVVLMISVFSLNFLLSLSGVLFLPYFERRGDLGPEPYGLAMAVLSAASLMGFLTLVVKKIPKGRQYTWFAVSTVAFVIARLTLFSFESLPVIIGQFVLFGFSVSIINSIIGASGQLMVPAHLRGKVFGFMGAMGTGLMPLGMALGGVLAEFFPIPTIQLATGMLVGLGFIPTLTNKEFRRMVNQEFNLPDGEEGGAGEAVGEADYTP